MAFVISSSQKLPLGSQTPGMAFVKAVCTATGVTSGIIYGSTNKVRKIYAWEFTPRQNITGGAFKVIKTLDPTTGAEILTLTCTASDVFDFWYLGEDGGDQ
jgi:hypothetical protein